MIYVVKLNNKEYEVEVEKGQANLVNVTEVVAPAPVVQTVVQTSAPVAAPVAAAPVATADGKPVTAPIPGVITDVKVAVGTSVKKGQLLLLMEAMKMENEIFAPQDGVVKQILVAKGASVATNDILLIIQ